MKNLSWDEFKALSEAKQAAYQKHIDEAVERLARRAQELKRRRIEARAEYDAKFGPDGQDS